MMQKYINSDLVIYTSLLKEPVAEICEVRETSYLIRFMNGNFAKVTNANIAYNEIMKSDNFDYRIDVSSKIYNNLADAAYFIGGKNMMTKALELHVNFIRYYDRRRTKQ